MSVRVWFVTLNTVNPALWQAGTSAARGRARTAR